MALKDPSNKTWGVLPICLIGVKTLDVLMVFFLGKDVKDQHWDIGVASLLSLMNWPFDPSSEFFVIQARWVTLMGFTFCLLGFFLFVGILRHGWLEIWQFISLRCQQIVLEALATVSSKNGISSSYDVIVNQDRSIWHDITITLLAYCTAGIVTICQAGQRMWRTCKVLRQYLYHCIHSSATCSQWMSTLCVWAYFALMSCSLWQSLWQLGT